MNETETEEQAVSMENADSNQEELTCTLQSLLEQVDLLKSATHVAALNSQIAELKSELESSLQKLALAQSQVERIQKLYSKSQSYNLELKKQVAGLSVELLRYEQLRQSSGLVTFEDKEVQTDDINPAEEVDIASRTKNEDSQPKENSEPDLQPPANAADEKSELSLAESLKKTAESAVQQSGFTYDESTGLYYDYNSGYYYDPAKSLYYEPNSGTYYYFNNETQQYEFHSQVDLKQLKKDMDKYKKRSGRGHESHEVRGSRRDHDKDSGKTRRWNERNSPRPREKESSSHGKEKDRKRKRHSNHGEERREERKRSKEEPRRKQREEEKKAAKEDPPEEGELEDGEISSDSPPEEEAALSSVTSEDNPEVKVDISQEELAASYLPCIRAIVIHSECLDVGHLCILTCTGATIGKDDALGHALVLADPKVSKMHCEVNYDSDLQRYVVIDHASNSGTFVNEQRIGKAKAMSAPHPLYHGDKLKMGDTEFELHIHRGSETCDGCEPGLIQSQIETKVKESVQPDKEVSRKEQLKMIKKKYGLQDSQYAEDSAAINNPKYQDKAAIRRKKVGSDNPYQKNEAPASVHRAISSENKGHKLLAKMGWKEGTALGKSDSGIVEPIQVNMRAKQSAGLGAYSSYDSSLDSSASDIKHRERLIKTKERFERLDQKDDQERDF